MRFFQWVPTYGLLLLFQPSPVYSWLYNKKGSNKQIQKTLPENKHVEVILTPLEKMLKEKREKKEEIQSIATLTEKDILSIERIFDGIIDTNLNRNDSVMETAGLIICCALFYKYKITLRRKNTNKSKKSTFPIFVITVLINFTRNIKPAE